MFKVEKIVPEGTSKKDLEDYIAELSSVVRDKSPKSAEKLFKRLLTESVGDKASRVLEYIPCTISSITSDMFEEIQQFFGFFSDSKYHTNARELLNWGWEMKDVLKTVDFTNYAVFKCETPYFIYGQVSTHNQLTTVSHSQRYAECDRGFWMPPEVGGYLNTVRLMIDPQDHWDNLCENAKPSNLTTFMKSCGVVRKEIFSRGRDMLQNRVFVIGGYTNNPNAWGHFLEQRLDKHTQLETREFAMMLDEQINPS